VSDGYLMMEEFATSLVPMGSVSTALAEGFIVVCVAFFEWGFGLPSHQFLRSFRDSTCGGLHDSVRGLHWD
jgi:hypothetical protein